MEEQITEATNFFWGCFPWNSRWGRRGSSSRGIACHSNNSKNYNLRTKGTIHSTYLPMKPTIVHKKHIISTPLEKTIVTTPTLLAMEYSVIEDMKKTKMNVPMYDIWWRRISPRQPSMSACMHSKLKKRRSLI